MNAILTFVEAYLRFAWWQSTLILAASLLAARYYRDRPWRAHALLVLGVFAATGTPILSVLCHARGWGILPGGDVLLTMSEPTETLADSLFHWSAWLAALGGLVLALAVLLGIATSRSLFSRAKPLSDRPMQLRAEANARRFGRRVAPVLFTSESVRGPTIWCWGIHPAILFPPGMLEGAAEEVQDAFLLHELAHLERFDHWVGFLARLCGCLLFWNPLYWLAQRRGELHADEACDSLALYYASISADVYADTILRLATQPRLSSLFLFLSRKERIMQRVNHVLSFGRIASKQAPRRGKRWMGLALASFAMAMVALAVCQRPGVAADPPSAAEVATEKSDGPPRPVKIVPEVGATDVSPSLKEIRATFDRDMAVGSFSWCGGGPHYPKTTGMPKWIDKRTCVLPVKLEKGKAYRLSLNWGRFQNFRSADGVPAVPTPVYFCTEGASRKLVAQMTPPKVVKLSIENGAKDVPPGRTKLSVTFDQTMGGGMSWVEGPDTPTFEESKRSPWSSDKKTCTLYAELEPGRDYTIYLNSEKFGNFTNELGVSLAPVEWKFSTSGEAASEPAEETKEDADTTGVMGLPAMKDAEHEAKPYPEKLVRAIRDKRAEIHSADYEVEVVRTPNHDKDAPSPAKCRFCFQGDTQWYADISEVMHMVKQFVTGSDGEMDWSVSVVDDKTRSQARPLARITEKNLSMLDPLRCLGVADDKLEERLSAQGIHYLGEESLQGEKWHLFGRVDRSQKKLGWTTRYEMWIHADTLLPGFSRAFFRSTEGPRGPIEFTTTHKFNIESLDQNESLDQKLPNACFAAPLPKGVEPEAKTEPDEGYDHFFVTIDDGADGRMSVRVNGQKGPKGTNSGGLN